MGDGKTLTGWTECGVNIDKLPKFVSALVAQGNEVFAPIGSAAAPGIYVSGFKIELPDNGTDIGAYTYFDPINWGKGQLFVNNYNVGRYWSSAGPQVSLKRFLKTIYWILALHLRSWCLLQKPCLESYYHDQF